MFDAKTPEAAAYLAAREATEKSRQQIWRRVAVALLVALGISAGTAVYNGFTISSVKDSQGTVAREAHCQQVAFDRIIRLAFTGDKNKADYLKATRGC